MMFNLWEPHQTEKAIDRKHGRNQPRRNPLYKTDLAELIFGVVSIGIFISGFLWFIWLLLTGGS